ncbi:VWA domain-containing protein [Aestuariivivens sediminis]|uniref:VWA domain-containing protein n=1 Tax=Aestuariivivens sediminis TaxID=2913557 RepID=UPI001F5876E5|nr:VWA domain-containing protein [Aestuariivivens sediminis]
MNTETILYIILSGILALLLAGFQYIIKLKSITKLSLLFLILRFLTLFSVLLLLINPKFDQVSVSIEKPHLIIAIDNSNSIRYLNQQEKVKNLVQEITENESIKRKFDLDFYTFGEEFKNTDSLTFLENQTNIDNVFDQLGQIYKQTISPTLLITDGNQTYGNDYEFSISKYNQMVYPVILGDTVTYTDLKIQQLNVNKYAFLKNQFPIEAILVYNGTETINSKFIVTKGNITVFSQNVSFNNLNNSKILSFTLPALKTGVGTYKATLLPIDNEKNKINNSKDFAVEVMDQKTKIALVSSILHPDLGAFKKSIEHNEQRSVLILNPEEAIKQIDDFQLLILYQPNGAFRLLIETLDKVGKNKLMVIGPNTDLNFLNRISKNYQFEISGQYEYYQADLNNNFSPFLVEDISFETLPPLKSYYGSIEFKTPYETILDKTINNIPTDEPLLATMESNHVREVLLLGENIWQWRAQSYLNYKSFNEFDDFVGKIIQYLASNTQRNRLNLEYETFYDGNTGVILKAQFFDKNYQFDSRESISIVVKDNISEEIKTFPFVLKNNNYEVDLSNLRPSEYSFTVKTAHENLSTSGSFRILEYNVEQQFLNANVAKLQRLAARSEGRSYFIDEANNLVNDLLNDNRFLPIQKSHKNSLPLIDWKYLLSIIVFSLSAEWFLRKYNGLI